MSIWQLKRSSALIDPLMIRDGRKLTKFLAAGVPAVLLAIPLNYALVSIFHWDAALAYALVLVFQVTVNFFMCSWFVFESTGGKSRIMQFWLFFSGIIMFLFFSGIIMFRVVDWVVYTALVKYFDFNFIVIQVMNVVAFALLKFKFSKKIMEGKA